MNIGSLCRLIILLLCVTISSTAAASPFNLRFSGYVEARYDDNIFFSVVEPLEDYITVVSPCLSAAYKTELTQLELTGNPTYFAYKNIGDQDNIDQRYSGYWHRKWTHRLQTSLNSSYIDDQRRDRILEESGLLTENVHRREQNYTFAGQYVLSELQSISISYGFKAEAYDDPTINDLIGHNIQIGLHSNLTGIINRTTSHVLISYNYYSYSSSYSPENGLPFDNIQIEQQRDIDTYALSLGLDPIWTDKIQLNLSAGVRYTQIKAEIQQNYNTYRFQSTQENDPWGFLGTFRLVYTGLTSTYSMSLSHDLVPASGQNGLAVRTNIGLSSVWRIYGEWYLGGNLDVYLNRSDNSGASADIDYLTTSLAGTVKYQLSRYWSIGFRYTYYQLENRQADTRRDRDLVVLNLGWNIPIWE